MNLSTCRHLAAIFALIAALGCAEKRGDSADRSRSGPRLAVLSPACAIILRDLDREEAVVARHGWDLALDSDLPVAGDQSGLDYETLLRVDPTDVVLERSAQEIPDLLLEYAGDRGWRIHTVPMLTLGDIRSSIGIMDRISSSADEMTSSGEHLIDEFDSAISPEGSPGAALGRTLPVIATDPAGVMGPGSFHAQLLSALGATPIPREGDAYITLDTEDVIRMDPDSIVLIMPGQDAASIDSALGPFAGVGLRAVESGRVLLINHPHALTPSTSLIEVARDLVRAARELGSGGDRP